MEKLRRTCSFDTKIKITRSSPLDPVSFASKSDRSFGCRASLGLPATQTKSGWHIIPPVNIHLSYYPSPDCPSNNAQRARSVRKHSSRRWTNFSTRNNCWKCGDHYIRIKVFMSLQSHSLTMRYLWKFEISSRGWEGGRERERTREMARERCGSCVLLFRHGLHL